MSNASALYKNRKCSSLRAAAIALALVAGLFLGAGQAMAKNSQGGGYSGPGQAGGYTGPGPEFVTVEQAKGMKDDAHVALKGYIIQRLGGGRCLRRGGFFTRHRYRRLRADASGLLRRDGP